MNLKVNYSIDNDSMTDEEFENQEDRDFIITEDMLIEIIERYDVRIKQDDTIDINYIRKE